MNIFSSDPFLHALAATYFPDRPAEIAIHTVEGHAFRLLRIGKKAITAPPMVDYWEPVATDDEAGGSHAYPLRSLPRVALTTTAFTGTRLVLDGTSAAPYIDLRKLPTWEDVERFVHGRHKRVFSDSRRQMRRLEHEAGTVVFRLDDQDDDAIDRCVAWRSERFRSAAKMHRDPRHVAFLRTLRDLGVARVASLRAGEQLVAAVVGLPYEGRFSYWIVAYDHAFHMYSPGRLLLERLIAASVASGDVEFDFLIGSEAYKLVYATDARVVGPLGPQPALPAAMTAARRRLRLGRKYMKLRNALGR